MVLTPPPYELSALASYRSGLVQRMWQFTHKLWCVCAWWTEERFHLPMGEAPEAAAPPVRTELEAPVLIAESAAAVEPL